MPDHLPKTRESFRPGRIEPAMVVVAAGVVAALHVGKISPAIPVLTESLGLTLVQAGFLLSLVQLAGMLFGLAIGLTADGIGLRRSMLTGLAVLGVASLLGGFSQTPHWLLLLRSLEGLGFLLVSMPAPSLIRRLVSSQRVSVMLGLWGAYMPLGTAAALLVGPQVITLVGWPIWWWGLALITGLMALWLLRGVPCDSAMEVKLAPARDRSDAWLGRLSMTLKSTGPWLVALSFAMYSGQWLAVIGFLPTIYAGTDLAPGMAGLLTALVAGVNMAGNIASGRLIARGVSPVRLLHTGFAVMGLMAIIAFFTWPFGVTDQGVGGQAAPPELKYLAVLLFSMIGGMIPGTLFYLAVRVAPGDQTVSTTVGWMQQWASLGQFAGPPAVAWMASVAGGWHWTWIVTGACAVVGMALAWGLSRQGPARA